MICPGTEHRTPLPVPAARCTRKVPARVCQRELLAHRCNAVGRFELASVERSAEDQTQYEPLRGTKAQPQERSNAVAERWRKEDDAACTHLDVRCLLRKIHDLGGRRGALDADDFFGGALAG